MSIGASNEANNTYLYYYNDRIITRSTPNKTIFETRNFLTGQWNQTRDVHLISKMLQGKHELPSAEIADQLFKSLQEKNS